MGKKVKSSGNEATTDVASRNDTKTTWKVGVVGVAIAIFVGVVVQLGPGILQSDAEGDGKARAKSDPTKVSWNSGDKVDLDERSMATVVASAVEPQPKSISGSTTPRAFIFDNLVSDEECEFLKDMVVARLKPAGVVLQTEDKYSLSEEYRNNEQVWLTQKEENQIPVLSTLLKRLHRVAHIPMGDAEGLQIGRYMPGQKYEVHKDTDPAHDVARPATFLMYLSDVEAGGDTLFTGLNKSNCYAKWHMSPTGEKKYGCANCCENDYQNTLRVTPKKGRGVLFFNHDMTGMPDARSEHAACPVRAGVKWIAQRWFRYVPYQRNTFPFDATVDGLPSDDAVATTSAGPWDGRVRSLHDKSPRIYLLDNFLTSEESAHLIGLSKSGVLETKKNTLPEEVEESDLVVAKLVKRLHRATYVPEQYAEKLRINSQGVGSSVDLHYDSDKSGKRPATITVFLNDGDGGDIVFPLGLCSSIEECCSAGSRALRIPRKAGRAVLHFSVDAELKFEKHSKYGACPVKTGELWTMHRYFRNSKKLSIKHAADAFHDIVPSEDMISI